MASPDIRKLYARRAELRVRQMPTMGPTPVESSTDSSVWFGYCATTHGWMPEELRETLIRGFRERVSWWVHEVSDSSDAVLAALYKRPKSRFSYTRTLRAELTGSCVLGASGVGNR